MTEPKYKAGDIVEVLDFSSNKSTGTLAKIVDVVKIGVEDYGAIDMFPQKENKGKWYDDLVNCNHLRLLTPLEVVLL